MRREKRSLIWAGLLLFVAALLWVLHLAALIAVGPTPEQWAIGIVMGIAVLLIIRYRARRN